jgi:hypothetical protein
MKTLSASAGALAVLLLAACGGTTGQGTTGTTGMGAPSRRGAGWPLGLRPAELTRIGWRRSPRVGRTLTPGAGPGEPGPEGEPARRHGIVVPGRTCG